MQYSVDILQQPRYRIEKPRYCMAIKTSENIPDSTFPETLKVRLSPIAQLNIPGAYQYTVNYISHWVSIQSKRIYIQTQCLLSKHNVRYPNTLFTI